MPPERFQVKRRGSCASKTRQIKKPGAPFRFSRNGKGRIGFSSEVDTGSREENASNHESRVQFRFNRNWILGNIQQVKVRQQVHGEIAAERSVAVAAITADAGHLDRALIELDVVALMSLGR